MILKLIVLGTLLAAAHARSLSSRIIGGHDAKPGEFPHQVSLQWGWPGIIDDQHFCGGVILDSQWILTAAHCLEAVEELPEFGNFLVKAGKHDLAKVESTEQAVKVASYVKHEKYKGAGEVGPYDLGLLKLEKPLKFNKQVAAIKLPAQNSEPTGQVILSGWGATTNDTKDPDYPTILQTVTVPIVERKACNQAIEKVALEEGNVIKDIVHETNVCTGPLVGGISACSGDSGGPLIARNKNGQSEVVGIASFTLSPCARKGAPSVYVKISSFVDWIKKKKTL